VLLWKAVDLNAKPSKILNEDNLTLALFLWMTEIEP
jgi:hypothetical protein